MRNGVPSGTPFCLKDLSEPAAATGGRSLNLLGDGRGSPEAMPEMGAVAGPAACAQWASMHPGGFAQDDGRRTDWIP